MEGGDLEYVVKNNFTTAATPDEIWRQGNTKTWALYRKEERFSDL